MAAVLSAARVARSAATKVVLNAAPAQPLPPELLDAVDVLVVNEHEAAELGAAVDSVPVLVVTLGPAGARITDAAGTRDVPGIPAKVVDTTGAGDAFTGYLAAGLAAGLALDGRLRGPSSPGRWRSRQPVRCPRSPSAGAVDERSRG